MNRALASVLIGCMVGCATPHRQGVAESSDEFRIANLERAAKYPWKDEGACAVREASGEWRVLVERCFYALDRSRVMFRDVEHRCPVAQLDAATVEEIVGVCLLAQPELAVAAIIIIGAVIVGAAIAAELAPAKKAGCYCKCLRRGEAPALRRRVESQAACVPLCKGYRGIDCGGVLWLPEEISVR